MEWQNLSEGKTILANATPQHIMHKIREHMEGKLTRATQGFPWNWGRMVYRDVAGWVDLSGESPDHPYYYERCLVNSSGKSKDKGRTFKRPKNPFLVAAVIDAEQWDEYLEFSANLDVSACVVCA